MHFPKAAYRHAAYFAPAPDSLAWNLGSQWLGRCARTGAQLSQPLPQGWTRLEFTQRTQEPRRYGWHATLKAPFALAADRTIADLDAGFLGLSTDAGAPLTLPLTLTRMGHFLALVPKEHSGPLQRLADACVRELHDCAAPLPPSEIKRRSRHGLTPRQTQMLALWGYPYVMDDFGFHLTLTGTLDGLTEERVAQLIEHAHSWFAPLLTQGLLIDAVSWFAEDAPGADFRWVQRFGFEQ